MELPATITEYVKKHPNREKELLQLREIILTCELDETIKWGAPCYMFKGKNIVGIAAFKNYVGLWFFNGVFLKDKHKVLVNAQEGTTKALRQWRFNSSEEIDPKLISEYVMEAKANQESGKELKPVKAKKVDMPPLLKEALLQNKELKTHFNALTPGKQREYSEYIGAAKQESTRSSRLEKCIPMILNGKGLNDKYK